MEKDEIVTKNYLEKALKENNKILLESINKNIKKIVKEAIHEEFNGTLFSIRPAGKIK
jgi:hypothetical protein